MRVGWSSFGIGAGVGAALLIGIAIGVALPEPAALPVSVQPAPESARSVPGAVVAGSARRVDRDTAGAGISPLLLAALDAVQAGDPQGSQIDVRIVSTDHCGPTPAAGSDCHVEAVSMDAKL